MIGNADFPLFPEAVIHASASYWSWALIPFNEKPMRVVGDWRLRRFSKRRYTRQSLIGPWQSCGH